MFWALTIENNRKYTQKIAHGFHVSMAALESTPGEKKAENENISVMVEHNNAEYLLCTLNNNTLQQALDHIFEIGDEITFFHNGSGTVHLTGYHIPDDPYDDGFPDAQDSDEDDSSDVSEPESPFVPKKKSKQEAADNLGGKKRKQEVQKSSAAKKAKVEAEDSDDDDSDDSDFLADEASEEDDDDSDSEEEDTDDSDVSMEEDDENDNEELRKAVQKIMSGKPAEEGKKQKQVNGSPQKGNVTDKASKGTPNQVKTPNQQGKNTPNKVKTPNQQGKDTPNQQGKGTPNQIKTPNQQGKGTPNQQSQKKNKDGQKQQTPAQQNNVNDSQEQSGKKKKKKNKKNKGDLNSTQESVTSTPQNKSKSSSPNKGQSEQKTLPSGTILTDLKLGEGQEARTGRSVHVYYTGRLHKSGKEFDKMVDGKPFQFKMGKHEVIRGWEEGLQGMKVGGRRRIVIPPTQGYGSKQVGPIPPNSTLVFDVELKAVN